MLQRNNQGRSQRVPWTRDRPDRSGPPHVTPADRGANRQVAKRQVAKRQVNQASTKASATLKGRAGLSPDPKQGAMHDLPFRSKHLPFNSRPDRRPGLARSTGKSLTTALAATTAGTDGASHVASSDTVGGALWTDMAGFITALQSGKVTASLPTRAKMIANKVPAAITTITTSGFANAGDGGAATYVRATGPFADGCSFQSVDGAWWQFMSTSPCPAHFGAIGQANPAATLIDETTQLQAWITYLVSSGLPGAMPARTYLHTRSLNWGKTNPFDGKTLKIAGSVRGYTRIVSNLTENYPAHDFTNQNSGKISDIQFTGLSTSTHTCLCLFAETMGSGANNFSAINWLINDLGSSSKYAIFGLSADQFIFEKSSITTWNPAALACVFFSNRNPAAITSKFWSIAALDADGTLFQAIFSAFEGFACPGLWTNGFNGVQLYTAYAGTTNNGAPTGVGHTQGMFRFGSGTNNADGSTRNCVVMMLGCRTEDNNQPGTTPLASVTGSIAPGTDNVTSILTVTSGTGLAAGMLLTGSGIAAGTVVLANLTATTWQVSQVQTVASTTISAYLYSTPAIYLEDAIYESTIQGAFGTTGAGVFGGPGIQVNSQVSAALNFGAFHNAGALRGGRFHFSGGTNYGGSFDQTNSRGYTLGGRVGASEPVVLAAYGGTMGELSDLSNDYNVGFSRRLRADTRVFFTTQNTNTPTNFGLGWRGGAFQYNVNSYTGGSGLQQIATTASFNPSCLFWDGVSSSELIYPNATFVINGMFNSSWAASGEMKFTIQQTVNGTFYYQTLIDVTGIPAYGASTAWKLTLELYGTFGNFLAYVYFDTYGTTPLRLASFLNLGSLGFSAQNGALVSINQFISNTGSNPLVAGCVTNVLQPEVITRAGARPLWQRGGPALPPNPIGTD
eukprot:gene18711-19012_t